MKKPGGSHQHPLSHLLDWTTRSWGTGGSRGRDRQRSSPSGPLWNRQSPGYEREWTGRKGGMILGRPEALAARVPASEMIEEMFCILPSAGSSTSGPWAFRRLWRDMESCRGSQRTCPGQQGQMANEAEGKNGLWLWVHTKVKYLCDVGTGGEICLSLGVSFCGPPSRPTQLGGLGEWRLMSQQEEAIISLRKQTGEL
jgi:hypothetical protein